MPYLFILVLFLTQLVWAQSPVHWNVRTRVEPTSVNSSFKDSVIISLEAQIEPGWHLYSQQMQSEGPVPTRFDFSKCPAHLKLWKAPTEVGLHKNYVPAFGDTLSVFHVRALFLQTAQWNSNRPFSFDVPVEYMVCNDRFCMPPKTDILHISSPVK